MPKKSKKTAAASKSAVTRKSPKAKTPKKATGVKSKGRGQRYTAEQKNAVLNYVAEVNAKKGRGGAAAASRKFKISQITIGQWVKKSGAPTATNKPGPKKAGRGRPKSVGNNFSAQLRRLADVHEAITQCEAELSSLRKEYDTLKKAL